MNEVHAPNLLSSELDLDGLEGEMTEYRTYWRASCRCGWAGSGLDRETALRYLAEHLVLERGGK